MLSFKSGLPLIGVLTVLAPLGADARSRDDVMKDAARYTEHTWQMRASNQKGSCKEGYKSDHAVGAQVGLPYAWGASMTLEEFDKRLASGAGAGSHSSDGILSCVAGVDCSGFVSQVWKLPQRQSTSTMSKVTNVIKLEELRPGDALNKSGSHIVLFAGLHSDGRPIIYEASGGASRVRMATPSWSYLSGYQPVRYKGIEEPATVATVTPAAGTGTSTATTTKAATATTTATTTKTATTAAAADAARVSLRFNADIGFQPAGEDAQAIGPDYLTAGPGGSAAVYDRVRHQVVVIARAGTHSAFEVGPADGLSFTDKGDVVVMDGGRRQARIYSAGGKLLRTIDIPSKGLLGTLTLEDGVLYHVGPDGQRKAVGELVDGTLRPPRPSIQLSGNQLLRGRELAEKTGFVEVGDDKVAVPTSARISGRPMGPWLELSIATTDERGTVKVQRTLRRPGQPVVSLPVGQDGAYAPIADLAVDRAGSALYLAPAKDAVAVVWVDAK